MSHFSRAVVFASVSVISASVAACGSSSGGGANPALSCAAAGGMCSLAAGMYTVHFTPKAGSDSRCPPIPDQTQTVTMGESAAQIAGNFMMSSMTTDGGFMCSQTGGSSCSTMLHCSFSTGSGTNTISENLTASIAVGTNTWCGEETVSASAQGQSLTCTYDFSVHM
jgi:hypothetical protein